MQNQIKEIRTLTLEDIQEILMQVNEKSFRAQQIWEWIWKKNVSSIDEMTNLSISLRNFLKENFTIQAAQIHSFKKSSDNTIKMVFRLHDNTFVEGVLIPSSDRVTACISSQVGCTLGCKFCATGEMGFTRSLTAGEIVDQIALLKKTSEKEYGHSLSNIVYMGMGEPLLNYDDVLTSINNITNTKGWGMSPSRITLSTVGLPKMIKKLADDDVKFNLAISLHTAQTKKRDELMPINISQPLDKLAESIRYFHKKTGTRVTFEYVLLHKINDSLEDAKSLANFCRIVPCKVNIIEFNPFEGCLYQPSPSNRVKEFAEFLESKNMIVNVRQSRGKDIDAACGQLANKH